ncbi:MAG: DNA-binding transcriptional ArsR family regulator [Myxococcota bacterium]|jgi:DNA-binding transcriptional ArsR family regulator
MLISDALRAIAEPRRRRILMMIWDEELCAGEIAASFEISRPAVSQHLKVLRESGLVRERRRGTQRMYQICPQGMADLRRFMEHFTLGDFLWDEEVDGDLLAVA